MTIEITTLALSIVLGIIHLVMSSHFASFKYGYKWTASNREKQMPPLDGIHGRMERIAKNYLETFPFFAAAVIINHITGHHNAVTIWGSQLYIWGRIGYAICYAIGIPLIRSLIWNVATIGILLLLVALL